MTFAAGVVVGVLGTLVVSVVALLVVVRVADEPEDPAAEALWSESWPPVDELAARRTSGGQP